MMFDMVFDETHLILQEILGFLSKFLRPVAMIFANAGRGPYKSLSNA